MALYMTIGNVTNLKYIQVFKNVNADCAITIAAATAVMHRTFCRSFVTERMSVSRRADFCERKAC